MRPGFLIPLVLALVLAACSPPQPSTAPDSTAPEGATKIIAVVPNMNTNEAYRRTARVLQDSGFTIKSSDPKLRSITTSVKSVEDLSFGGADYEMKLQSTVREGPTAVHFSGTYTTETFGERSISRSGNQGTVPRKTWLKMYKIASAVSDSLRFTSRSE